ncbi:cyclophilin-like fold protein [Streptomyces coeruleorubidus]|uniref:cyclophilin-like fold protein n=1 Tax=Streptomyces coeruleorubidus TaxID=116188 RepID=UPI0037A5EF61
MVPSALRLRAHAVAIAVVLLTVTACTDDPPAATPSSTSSPSSPAAGARQTPTAQAPAVPSDRNTAMAIRLTVDGHAVEATLNDSAAARDFAALLPLTLDLSDFHGTERVADLPRRLNTSGAPDAAEGKAGDLAYYAPWATWPSTTATAAPATPAWSSSAISPTAPPSASPPPTTSRSKPSPRENTA